MMGGFGALSLPVLRVPSPAGGGSDAGAGEAFVLWQDLPPRSESASRASDSGMPAWLAESDLLEPDDMDELVF
jgi:hypothetical protein